MARSLKLGTSVARRFEGALVIPVAMRETGERLALCALICGPVLIYGGNVGSVECAAAMSLCLAAAFLFLAPAFDPLAGDRRVQFVLAATSLLALWPMVQLVPHTAVGAAADQWAAIAALGTERAPFTATLAVDETWRALPVAFATWGAFWIGVLSFGRRSRQNVLWMAVLLTAVADCAYGLGMFASGRNEVLGIRREAWVQDATGGIVSGTFINRNHFAFLCCVGLAIALTMLSRERHSEGKSLRQRVRAIVERWPILILGPVAAVLLVSIFLSQSRGAMLSALVLLGFALILRTKRGLYVAAGVLALVIALPLLYQATQTTEFARARVETGFGASAAVRLEVQLQTMRAIRASGGLGVGAGAFEAVFPLYRDTIPADPGVWNAAHGSYVEWPFTYGIPWALLLVLTTVAVMTTILRQRQRTGDANADCMLLVLLACLLHIAYDFGLQTLGLTLIVAALAGSSFGRAVGARARAAVHSSHVSRAATPKVRA